ncbi:MAG: pyridoxamine 5'-phosphate oxidase family protein [Terrimicrobiaceae bacterium]
MAAQFMKIASTPSVLKAQEHYFGKSQPAGTVTHNDVLTPDEIQFIESRDSFYLASVNSDSWPYIQHRGGRPGFLRATSPSTLAFADYMGNRQMLTTGNVSDNDRVCLFLMDYPHRARLKILGHARVLDARDHADLVPQLAEPDTRRIVERIVQIEVVGYDWNCPKYITPRYSTAEVQEAIAPMKARIAELEAELASIRPGLNPKS